jgi:hypothetical protein
MMHEDSILEPVKGGEVLARTEIASRDSIEDELSNNDDDIIVAFTQESIDNSNKVAFAEKA